MAVYTHTDVLFTLIASVSAGTVLSVIARRLDLPVIVLLLLSGIALGPQGLGIVEPESLQLGLPAFVSFAIGLILFEGGLTLDLEGYRAASRIIIRLLTVGLLTTWFATAGALWWLLGLPIDLSLVSGSLVIVTGPTVITPLLKRIRVHHSIHNILHWEAVLIDPIGVFIAVLWFEWISGLTGQSVALHFLLRILTGVSCGVAGGLLLAYLIRKNLFGDESIDVVPLALAAAVFGAAETIVSESGLLATTTAGFVLALSRPRELRSIRRFKAIVSDLLIGMLFIILAARLNLLQFTEFGIKGILTVGVVVFIVRLLNIMLSTFGESLGWRERAFLAWVAPRGIVAASMSSLFALRLQEAGVRRAEFVETFTYSVIVVTVLLQGLTAGGLARRLGLRRSEAVGWLIVGAHLFGRQLAEFISRTAKVPVVLIDTNERKLAAAREVGLNVLAADARDLSILDDHPELQAVGNLLAITDNEDLNSLLCQRWVEVCSPGHVFAWHSSPAVTPPTSRAPETAIWAWLPKPSIVSGDLERRMLCLTERSLLPAVQEMPSSVLLLSGENVVTPFSPAAPPSKRNSETRALLLERRGSHVLGAIHRNLFLRTPAKDMEELLKRMTDHLVAAVPSLPVAQIATELLQREKTFPSTIGHGVAIPHTYSKSVGSRVCVIAVVPDGFEHPSPDGQPVRLVFLIVGPPGDPEGHLAMIAEIARIVSTEDIRAPLLRAQSFDEVLAVVQAAINTVP